VRAASPPIVDVNVQAIERVLERVQALLLPEDFELIKAMADTLVRVTKLVRERGSTIVRLRRLFGLSGSEKTRDVVGPYESTGAAAAAVELTPAQSSTAASTDSGDVGKGGATPPSAEGATQAPEAPPEKKTRRGHGRIAATDYRAAVHIAVAHQSLRAGNPCPHCDRGSLYSLSKPASILRITGQPPLVATCSDCDCLRCATCGIVYTARAPDQAQGKKFDETATSMIALLRYGTGMPFNRLDHLQRDLDTPLPASTQWDVVNEGVALVEPAFDELKRLAAQGEVLHNDDSYMRVLEFMGKRRAKLVAAGKLPDPERTGLFTTAIVSVVAGVGTIALFATGRKHADENLAAVLDMRANNLPPPIQMGDALTRNLPKGHLVVESNCIAHGRRKLVDEIDNYPAECRFIIERLALVFKLDDECATRGLSDQERLLAHQDKSAPLMEEIRARMQTELGHKRIEPNSDLGRAFNYFLKHVTHFVNRTIPRATTSRRCRGPTIRLAYLTRRGKC
jgi:hypothetical protein